MAPFSLSATTHKRREGGRNQEGQREEQNRRHAGRGRAEH